MKAIVFTHAVTAHLSIASPGELYWWRFLAFAGISVTAGLLVFLLLHSSANRKRAEASLRLKEMELNEAQRLSQIGTWSWDSRTDSVVFSSVLCRLFGIDPAGQSHSFAALSKFFTPDSWAPLAAKTETALRTGEGYGLHLKAQSSDGSQRSVVVRGELVRDANGSLGQLRGTIQDITEREKIEEQLQENRDRLTAILASTMDAIIAVDEKQRIVVFNPAAESIFACKSHEAMGSSIEKFIPQGLRAAHCDHIQHFGESGVTSRPMGDGLKPLFGQRTDGTQFPIEASISHVLTGQIDLFIVVIRDITARLLAEKTARESEKRFRLMADSAPVLMWMSDADGLWCDFNKEWLKFSGRTIEQELGEGWTEGIHPNDVQVSRRTYKQSFDSRQPLSLEHRLRRHDGQYRWLLDNGVPRFCEDGSFAGFIGCCIDITEQKETKATQAELGGRLMQAHEEERQRIARELHDDINQRLALLANEIQELEQTYVQAGDRAHERGQLQAFRQKTTEIAADLQRLSHQLHPSKLHYLGLTAAVRGLCQEFSKLRRIEVDCIVRGLPSDLNENISLNLFRTAQESLHNIAKHSRAHFVKVELTGKAHEIRLRISDDGIGFDYEQGKNGQGLGLVSMKERLTLLGGSFSIWSRPALGTQVEATVPLKTMYAKSA